MLTGHELRALRVEKGLTTVQMEVLTRYSQGYISRVERGKLAVTEEFEGRFLAALSGVKSDEPTPRAGKINLQNRLHLTDAMRVKIARHAEAVGKRPQQVLEEIVESQVA